MKTISDYGKGEVWRISPHVFAYKASNKHWKPYRHLKYLSNQIAEPLIEGNARFIITMPPRHGKSEFISHWIPTWFLDLFPYKRVGLGAYSATFAKKWGRKVSTEFKMNKHLMNQLNPVTSAGDRFEIDCGGNCPNGGMITAGVDGPFTGEGFELLIIDDPIKNQKEAMSETKRKGLKEWFTSVATTRLEPGASVIILMTRWHEDDLVGWLLGGEDLEDEIKADWKVINLPAVAEENNDPIGRKIGQALCPERYDEPALETRRKEVGAKVWNSLYQQRPTSAEGAVLKRDWWKFYNHMNMPNSFDQMIQSWDMRFGDKKDAGSYVVGQVWGRVKNDYYLIDQMRGRWDFTTSKNAVIEMTRNHPKAVLKLIENKANGAAIENALKNVVTGIKLVNPDGGKFARVSAVQPVIETGHVYLPDVNMYSWVEEFIEEAAAFSEDGSHKEDDQVDAMSQALNFFEDITNSTLFRILN